MAHYPPIAHYPDNASVILVGVAERFGWTDPDSAPGQAYDALGVRGELPSRENVRRILDWLAENAH